MNIEMLSDYERDEIVAKLDEFIKLGHPPEDDPRFENVAPAEVHVVQGDARLRFFPTGYETMRFELRVDPQAEWYEDLSAYSPGHLAQGGPLYKALSDELNEIVRKTVPGAFTMPTIADKGSKTYSGEMEYSR